MKTLNFSKFFGVKWKCEWWKPPLLLFAFDHLFRIALGNYTDPHSWPQMDRVKVFLHPPGKFVYFAEPDTLPNNYKIDNLKLRYSFFLNYWVWKIHIRKDHENSFTLSKVSNTYLSRTDRECESKSNYNWGYCLDELFMLRKGKY